MNCTAEMSDNIKSDEFSVGRSDSLRIPKPGAATTKISLTDPVTPTLSASTPGELSPGEELRMNAFGKVTGLLHKSLLASGDTPVVSSSDCEYTDSERPVSPDRPLHHKQSEATLRPSMWSRNSLTRSASPVKETKRVMLEFDPITKRKVLNTYEILGEIGRGEHGIVKLAKDLVNKDLVAIKIVNRKSKKDRPRLRMRLDLKTNGESEHEIKIRREIAIMKKCFHKHIVQLREVLDDTNSHKIYLVLEYLEKGEVKWKRSRRSFLNNTPAKVSENIPCCGTAHKHRSKVADDEDNLLSNEFLPNLTFKQSRKIFRDVLLGLEYLHLQGIVHRDIKPANLLVSSDNIVKISDFGVSFASSLDDVDEGLVNELELAKTAGTPAFFAPELCQTNFSSSRKNSKSASQSSLEVLKNDLTLSKVLPKIDYKIDIWALGVTFYCLLFGKLPFNAESEFELFLVIVNNPLEFPKDKDSFNSPTEVSQEEFDLAKDILSKLLDKNSATRIEVKEIKEHPFVLMDLEDDLDALNELLYLNDTGEGNFLSDLNVEDDRVSKTDIDNAVVGIGTRIKRSIFRAITSGGNSHDARKKYFLNMDRSSSMGSSSDESSTGNFGSGTNLGMSGGTNHSVILSEGLQQYSSATNSPINMSRTVSQQLDYVQPFPNINVQSPNISRSSSYPLAGIREGRISNPIIQDVIETNLSSSRRGSASANEVETKRNVGGDLYLRNQSVVDTFKGLQQLDDKRRRSSTYSSHHSSNSQVAKNSASLPPGETPSPSQPMNIPGTGMLVSSNQIRVGPISTERRESSVISIPLTASFASLDSVNDDYLSYKYHEYNTKRKHHNNAGAENESTVIKVPEPNHPAAATTTEVLTEKFLKFNLDNSMKRLGITFDISKPRDLHEGIAPKTIASSNSTSTSGSSYSSYSSDADPKFPKASSRDAPSSESDSEGGSENQESDESDESDDSEEDGNLTLAFSSRVQPSRPQFLSLKNRAISHDSSLSQIHHQNMIPVVYPNDGNDFEELPEGLMDKVPRPSIAAVPLSLTQNLSTSSNDTTSTITQSMSSSLMQPEDTINIEDELRRRINSQRKPSPLVTNAPSSAYSSTNSAKLREEVLANRQFNNHYKKEPVSYPFPKAIHNETGKETRAKTLTKEENRPLYYRSNSITLGILQLSYDAK